MNTSPGGAAPKGRTSAETAREAVLAAGLQLLAEQHQGMGVGVELKSAIAISGVPQSSAYRLFSGNDRTPQRNFATELLEAAIRSGNFADPSKALEAIGGVLAEAGDFDAASPAELAAILREVIRQASLANILHGVSSFEFPVFASVLASIVHPDHQVDEAIVEAVSAVEREETRYMRLCKDMATLFGLRLRDGWTWATFEAVIGTAAIGSTLRHRLNPNVTMMRSTGPNGEEQEWTSLGVTIEATVLLMAEPNPRIINTADISTWLN